MKTFAWVAAVVTTGLASVLGGGVPDPYVPEAKSAEHVTSTMLLQAVDAVGTPDEQRAEAFLNSVTGSDAVVCALVVQGISNRWSRYASMVSLSGLGMPSDEDRAYLNWAMGSAIENDDVMTLARSLSHGDACRRQTAAALFGRVEEFAALQALEPLAVSGPRNTRIAAIKALGYVEAEESIDVLVAAAQGDDAEIRQVAIWALGAVESKETIPVLARALQDADAGVRGNAAWALGEVEDGEAVPALSRALEGDREVKVRLNAAWALGQIEHPDGVPVLTRVLGSDVDPRVRRAAAWALGQMS